MEERGPQEPRQAPAAPAAAHPPPPSAAASACSDFTAVACPPAAPPAAAPVSQPRRPIGEIVSERNLFKVVFPRNDGLVLTLGLFGTLEEAMRVVDVLNIKQAIDAMQSLSTLPLHFSLQRYEVDDDKVAEVRSMSFRQVAQDLQVCAVDPLYGRCGTVTSHNEVASQRTITHRPAGEIVNERNLFKVVFPCSDGQVHSLGPFLSPDEAKRVLDMLQIKHAVDAGQPLSTLPLHLPLGRYRVDENLPEIRSLTFRSAR